MLGAQRYPFDAEPYASTPRTRAFDEAATAAGLEPFFPPLAVTFAAGRVARRPSASRSPSPPVAPTSTACARITCRLCGECDIGCNYGAKNTLDYNYLSAAVRAGGEIRDRCEVRELEPRDGGGYVVRYVEHDLGAGGPAGRHRAAAAPGGHRRRARRSRPARSARRISCCATAQRLGGGWPALGTRFSGNGDLLTLARPAAGRSDRRADPRRGRRRAVDHGGRAVRGRRPTRMRRREPRPRLLPRGRRLSRPAELDRPGGCRLPLWLARLVHAIKAPRPAAAGPRRRHAT